MPGGSSAAPAVVAAYAAHDWIGNSRNPADEQVLRLLASMAGTRLHVTHEADSLDLVDELVLAGLGVGLLERHLVEELVDQSLFGLRDGAVPLVHLRHVFRCRKT